MSCIDVTMPQPPSTTGKIIYVSAAVIYDADGRVLLAEHQKPDWRGYWEFPGGRIEDGETPEAALVRELQEELDIKTSISCLSPLTFISYRLPQFHVVMFVYALRQWLGAGGLPVATPVEGQKLKWVLPRLINRAELVPPDVPLLALL